MAVRENGFGPVKSWIMTPAQRAEHERRVREKSEGPLIKKWQRTMTKEQYLEAVTEGRSREDIVLKHYNNDRQELWKQLREWGIKPNGEGTGEMAKTAKPIEMTKEQYLQRRLNGETRSRILNSLGVAKPRAYELLAKWGIRELDAEERELELLAPVKPASEVGKRVAEQIEQNAEARAVSEQEEPTAVDPVTTDKAATTEPAGFNVIQEQFLRNQIEALKVTIEDRGDRIEDYERELQRWEQVDTEKRLQINELTEERNAWRSRAEELADEITGVEEERSALLQTIETAVVADQVQAAQEDAGMITIRIPILPVAIAHFERARIYESVEALSSNVEAADIDRERVMSELFDLLQRVVNFVTADLAELHPAKDVTGFVREFFEFYNGCHLDVTTNIKAAG